MKLMPRQQLPTAVVVLLLVASSCVAQQEQAAQQKAGAAAAQAQQASARKGLSGAALEAALKAAEKLQKDREQQQEQVVAQEVEQAAAAELANGDDDVSTTGKCRSDIDFFCQFVDPGEGRLAACLIQQQLQEEAQPDSVQHKVTDACRKELDAFKIDEASNINKKVRMAKACKKDIRKLCAQTPPGNGQISSCLRSQPELLQQKCYDEVFKAQQAAADDIRQDPLVYTACKADIEKKCKSIEPHKGRIQQCLRKSKGSLAWECREQLFKQSMEFADDLRLSTFMFAVCLDDKKKFCADVPPGHARAMDCLEDHRQEPNFSSDCRDAIEANLAERSTDFRLNPALRRACSKDIERVCGRDKGLELQAAGNDDGPVIRCLQDYREELQELECLKQVHRVMQRGAQDIRFGPSLGVACYEDRLNFCSSVPPGSARVIRCLQDRREKLSSDCKAALFDQETSMGESIDFQYPMKVACEQELEKFCTDVPHDHARAIRCLQDHQDSPGFGDECKSHISEHEHHLATDYRLDFQLAEACNKTTSQLCSDVHCSDESPCGGAMLRCLTDKLEQITDADCRKEVEYFERMEVRDFRNDIILAEACHQDVQTHCAKTKPGGGRMHQCLRKHMHELSDGCRREEQRLMTAASASVELQPALAADCAAERAEYCAEVRPGSSRIYNCLVGFARQAEYSQRCRSNLAGQQVRRLKDWQQDYNVRTACAEDAPNFCAFTLGGNKPEGETLDCLISHEGFISPRCRQAAVQAVFDGLLFYQPELPIIKVCDEDAAKFCLLRRGASSENATATLKRDAARYPVGQVHLCLSDQSFSAMGVVAANASLLDLSADAQVDAEAAADGRRGQERATDALESLDIRWTAPKVQRDSSAAVALEAGSTAQSDGEALQPACRRLLSLTIQPTYESFEQTLASSALARQLVKLESQLHLPGGTLTDLRVSDEGDQVEHVVTLTGWSALAGMFALAAVVLGGIAFGWQRWYSSHYGKYTLVMKNPPRSERSVELQ